MLEDIRSHALALPPLAKFALGMVMILGIPPLLRRVRLPTVVALLLSGVLVGPHVLDIFGEQRPIAAFLADMGMLLSMFVTGLRVDLLMYGRRSGGSFSSVSAPVASRSCWGRR